MKLSENCNYYTTQKQTLASHIRWHCALYKFYLFT